MRVTLATLIGACALAHAPLYAQPRQSAGGDQTGANQASEEVVAPADPDTAREDKANPAKLGETYRPADINPPVEKPDPAVLEARAKAANEAAKTASAKVVQASFDAWRARNFKGWLAKLAPDIQIMTPTMRISGREEARKIYRVFFDVSWPEAKILESGWTGERVYVVQEEFLPGGASVGVSYAEYEVADGLITLISATEL